MLIVRYPFPIYLYECLYAISKRYLVSMRQPYTEIALSQVPLLPLKSTQLKPHSLGGKCGKNQEVRSSLLTL